VLVFIELSRAFVRTQFLHSFDIPFTGYKCFAVFILNEPAQDVLLFLFQAMLTVWVYLLFGKSKLVLLCLVVGFLAAQGVSFTIAFMTWVIGPSLEKELEFAYLHTCEVQLPASFAWFSPASNSTLLGFEVMLSGFALRYAFKHLPKPFWRSPAQSLCTMASVIVHDNLVYFLIALFSLVVNIIAGAPFANPCASCWIIAKLARFLFLTMVGPWMILSSRRKHGRDVLGSSQSEAIDITTVRFASRSMPI